MNEKLKPCPFCGGEAKIQEVEIVGSIEKKGYIIRCTFCGIRQMKYALKPEYVINAWNTRVKE